MTAEEFWHNISVQSTLDQYGNYSQWDIEYAMIEFARLKGKEILEAAADKAFVVMKEDMDFYFEDYVEGVDKNSILNSYDLNSIV